MSSGNKYHRTITGVDGRDCVVDVYAVLVAFDVQCPARQHALKKILCTGIRRKGDARQDLTESIDAIKRAIDLLPAEKSLVDTGKGSTLTPAKELFFVPAHAHGGYAIGNPKNG